MGFKCGIVGLPNVGKSTLFNALTQTAAAQAANYPFCTIEPNVGDVAVPDPRLEALSVMSKTKKTVHASVQVVDIGGLVEGASKGEGLGNKFLANIREVDAIVFVLRAFKDDDVPGPSDPIEHLRVVEIELALADLETVEKRLMQVFARSNLYNCLHTLYGELGIFGTAALWVDEDEEDVGRGYALTAGEYWLASSRRLAVDTLYRTMWWSARQIVDTFGRVLLPPALGSMVIFMLMAAILAWRPKGLFPVNA